MNKIILLFAVVVVFLSVQKLKCQIFNEAPQPADTTVKPIIDAVPSDIKVEQDTSRFYTNDVTILNRGGSVLKISKVSGSCYCSSALIMQNNVYPLSTGELRLEINKDGLREGNNTIIFTVISNAQNSPFFINVHFKTDKSDNTGKEK